MHLALLGVLAALGILLPAGSSQAATLEEPWTPFGFCPVDDVAASTVVGGRGCAATASPRGTFKIGDTTAVTGRTEVQFGFAGVQPDFEVLPATEGRTLQAEPARVPGGLSGIVPPEELRSLLDLLDPVLGVKAQVQLAGNPSEFDFVAPILGGPVIRLPVRIHLQNAVLGPNCFIGSEEEPIVLRPRYEPPTTIGAIESNEFASFITLEQGTQVDDTFSVPEANGCGPAGQGLLDELVNLQVGLPSPAGQNELVLNDAAGHVAAAAGADPEARGQNLVDGWNAHVIEP